MKKELVFMFLSIILLTSLVVAETVVVSDNFESGGWNGGEGWLGGWYHQGDSSVLTGDSPYEGSYHLRLRRKNGYVDRMFDLSQYSDAKLTFQAKVKSFEKTDMADILVSSDGVNWNLLKEFTPADSDNAYHYYEFDLTPYGLTSTMWISIDAEMSGTGDYLYVDDIKIITDINIIPPEPAEIKTWHIQYNPTPTNPVTDVQYWNLDLFDVSNETMQGLKSGGTFVMCYFSGGSWEDWRPDADLFPAECLGNNNGWPGEKWLDTRCLEVRDIMKDRIDLGIAKGCDGFDPDNMDGYSNNPGFPLTEADAINYYNFLADYAHSQGKEIGLKNSLTIIDDVLTGMDWAINEQCFQYSECFYLDQVVNSGKPVFQIEYGGESKAEQVCEIANEKGYSTLIKNLQLDSFEISCLEYGNQTPPEPSEEIAYDGFEEGWNGGDGWFGGWYYEGDASLRTNDAPYEGSYHLRLRKNDGYVDRVVDLSSYSTAKLSFQAKVKSFEKTDMADILVSSDGVNWNLLKEFTPADSDNAYHYYEFDLTPYGLTSTMWISIDAEMSGTGDYLYVDELKILE